MTISQALNVGTEFVNRAPPVDRKAPIFAEQGGDARRLQFITPPPEAPAEFAPLPKVASGPQFPELLSDLRSFIPKLALDERRDDLLRQKLSQARGELSARLKNEYAYGAEVAATELSETRRQLREARADVLRLEDVIKEMRREKRSEMVLGASQSTYTKSTAAARARQPQANGSLPAVASAGNLPGRASVARPDVEEAVRRVASHSSLDMYGNPAEGGRRRVTIAADSRVLQPTFSSRRQQAEEREAGDEAPGKAEGGGRIRVGLPSVYGPGSATVGKQRNGMTLRSDSSAKDHHASPSSDAESAKPKITLADYIHGRGGAAPPNQLSERKARTRTRALQEMLKAEKQQAKEAVQRAQQQEKR